MCELLDPDGALFGDRIIAAGASTAGDGAGGGLNKRLMQVRGQTACLTVTRAQSWWTM